MKRKTVLTIVVGAFVFLEFGAAAVQDKNLPHETIISNSIDELIWSLLHPKCILMS